jgi:hypothetical protein
VEGIHEYALLHATITRIAASPSTIPCPLVQSKGKAFHSDALNVDERSQVEALLELLYQPNEVPELQWKDGKEPKHHNFMVAVSATLIMRYPEIRDYYRSGGGSPIVHRVINVGMEAWKFQHAKSADDRLQLLSDKIRASFMQKIDGRRRELPDSVERTESLLTRLGDIVTANQSTGLRNTDNIAHLQHHVLGLRNDVAQNTQAVETMTGMMQPCWISSATRADRTSILSPPQGCMQHFQPLPWNGLSNKLKERR